MSHMKFSDLFKIKNEFIENWGSDKYYLCYKGKDVAYLIFPFVSYLSLSGNIDRYVEMFKEADIFNGLRVEAISGKDYVMLKNRWFRIR